MAEMTFSIDIAPKLDTCILVSNIKMKNVIYQGRKFIFAYEIGGKFIYHPEGGTRLMDVNAHPEWIYGEALSLAEAQRNGRRMTEILPTLPEPPKEWWEAWRMWQELQKLIERSK